MGLHRFYLYGFTDMVGWLLPIPTALGFYGLERVQQFGQDDTLSWMLIPLLGFTMAGCALNAIIYGLMPIEKWNARFNPTADALSPAGRTQLGHHHRHRHCLVAGHHGDDVQPGLQLPALFRVPD